MSKLYPPYLEGTLPAFCLTDTYGAEAYNEEVAYEENDKVIQIEQNTEGESVEKYYFSLMNNNKGNEPSSNPAYWQEFTEGDGYFTIPFEHNRAVSPKDVVDITLKAKSVQNDELVAGSIYGDYDAENKTIKFKVKNSKVQTKTKNGYEDSSWEILIGQFYKIQIAYVSDEVGYFSTVGVIKCTSTPQLSISDLKKWEINSSKTKFIGEFKQNAAGDSAEKVYSSNFVIKDLNGNIFAESGNCLHNVQNDDDSYTAKDEFYFNQELPFGEIYTIQYNVTTNNELYISSPKYYITQQLSLDSNLNSNLIADFNSEEGYVQLSLVGKTDENNQKTSATGAFMVSREDSLNPGKWEILYNFSLKDEIPDRNLFKDFTVEHGKTYTYSIQRVNSYGINSDRIESNTIYIDFEDIFVYDGERQLKLRFNPQVSSFKTQIAESRTDTIGSQYPFFFRNTTIGYKIIPVSALISMLSDDNEFFTTYEEILREKMPNERHKTKSNKKDEVLNYHNLIAKNQTSERLFKLKVLDWFNDGNPKLFRSPVEGNYLVRFMDTSLAPQPTLGRMLHTINTTAYECAEYNYDNLVKFKIIKDTELTDDDFNYSVDMWKEVDIVGGKEDFPEDSDHSENLIKSDESKISTTNVKFSDFLPGSVFKIILDASGDYNDPNSIEIVIGATGNYELNNVAPIYGIYLEKDPLYSDNNTLLNTTGKVLYQYKSPIKNLFDSIVATKTNISEYRQLVGPIEDFPGSLNDSRRSIGDIVIAKFYKRPVHFLYYAAKVKEQNSDTQEWEEINQTPESAFNNGRLYFDYQLTEPYSKEKSEYYSPFGLYILHNDILDGQSIGNWPEGKFGNTVDEEGNPLTNAIRDNHIFEQYYIDYLKQSEAKAEEVLSEEEFNNNSTLKILDAWNNEIFTISSLDWNIIFGENNDAVNLREIEYYELSNYFSENISFGRGVYGEIYFQQLTKEYSFENSGDIADKKQAWEDAEANFRSGEGSLEDVENAYNIYEEAVEAALEALDDKE